MTFFSTIADRRKRGTVDAALRFRKLSDTALSATGSTAGLAFYPRAQEVFKVCFSVAAYTGYAAGTAQWALTVEISDALNGTYTQIGKTLIPVGTAGELELALSGAEAAIVSSASVFIRVTATKTGAPGNLSYAAWIVGVC